MRGPGTLLPPEEIKRIRGDGDVLMHWSLKRLKAEARPHSKEIDWPPELLFRALVNNDLGGFKRMLAEHPEAVPYAMEMYAEHTRYLQTRGKGRPRREETLEGLERNANLAVAAMIYYRLGMIWQQELGFENRNEYPTRADIAAAFVGGVTPNQVQNYVNSPGQYPNPFYQNPRE
jgi:hypothetical protein